MFQREKTVLLFQKYVWIIDAPTHSINNLKIYLATFLVGLKSETRDRSRVHHTQWKSVEIPRVLDNRKPDRQNLWYMWDYMLIKQQKHVYIYIYPQNPSTTFLWLTGD